MAQELFALMEKEGWDGVAETKAQWESNFAPRKMVSGFMQDKEIGSKRLASMPDRVTNTIFTTDGGQVHSEPRSPLPCSPWQQLPTSVE